MNDSIVSKPILSARLVWRAIQVRLRFAIILATAFLIVGSWEAISNRGEAIVRRLVGSASGKFDQAVSADTEYFCPMDPGILSDWPGRCGACNMALVRRKKGDPGPRPDGVIARMQFSPYRIQLAGIQTALVVYEQLECEITGVGTTTDSGGQPAAHISLFARDFAVVRAGNPATVTGDGTPPCSGRVAKLEPPTSCLIAIDTPNSWPPAGSRVVAKVRVPIDGLEPFQSLPADLPPLRPGEPRIVYACALHPDTVAESPGRCALERNVLEARRLADNQRLAWWCPMHPSVAAAAPGSTCKACAGMALLPRVLTYRPHGQVLSIPESAVVDTGARRVAFVERMPGMFDAVEIVVGPRCGGQFPVVSGLAAGDRVATSGAMLIDAETRLDPALAASYFGATPRAGARPADAAASHAQAVCPVTGKALGSMGEPVRVDLAGQAVWICCAGCEGALRKDPARYLAKSAHSE